MGPEDNQACIQNSTLNRHWVIGMTSKHIKGLVISLYNHLDFKAIRQWDNQHKELTKQKALLQHSQGKPFINVEKKNPWDEADSAIFEWPRGLYKSQRLIQTCASVTYSTESHFSFHKFFRFSFIASRRYYVRYFFPNTPKLNQHFLLH